MNKDDKFDFTNTNWYELWMKQSKDFFDMTEKNLQDIFNQENLSNSQEQLKKMDEWF